MNVTFLGIGMEQLSVSLLASIAESRGHKVSLAFSRGLFQDRYNLNVPFLAGQFDDRKRLLDTITQSKPDVLACSALTSTYHWALEIAALAKDRIPGLMVVFGGVHPSSCSEQVIARKEVDAICIGDGDEAFPALLDAYANGEYTKPIPNIFYKNGNGEQVRGAVGWRAPDLSALPFFDKSLWKKYINVGDLYLTMTSRGCPFQCSFCFNSFYRDLGQSSGVPYVRSRSTDHVMEELTEAKKRYTLRCITFEDDAFTMDKERLCELLERYKNQIGVPFQCMAHSRLIDDEIISWLSDAGCTWVEMGVQSADEKYKKEQIGRNERNERIQYLIGKFQKAGIKVKCDHIFGMPGEAIESQETARKLYAQTTPNRITTYWATYLPATEMVRIGLDCGELTTDDARAIDAGEYESLLHTGSAGENKDKVVLLRNYLFLFRLLPILPKAIRKSATLHYIKWLPAPVAKMLGFWIDGVWGLISGNPEHRAYIRQYFRFIKDWLSERSKGT